MSYNVADLSNCLEQIPHLNVIARRHPPPSVKTIHNIEINFRVNYEFIKKHAYVSVLFQTFK